MYSKNNKNMPDCFVVTILGKKFAVFHLMQTLKYVHNFETNFLSVFK